MSNFILVNLLSPWEILPLIFKRLFFLCAALLLVMLSRPAFSTHIVGGEMELEHVGDFNYVLRLIQYFDEVNGNPGARDPQISVSIFRNSDDFLMRIITMPLTSTQDVSYTVPECAIAELVTDRLIYQTTIELPPEDFSDPEGYYVVWERCCRNNVISNVFQTMDNEIGQTFFLEFPPVMKDGKPFVNSTPLLFPPLSDYACAGVFYYADFSGTDLDGDSLVYSLANPLNSSSNLPVPPPSPKPHSIIPWAEGFSVDNMVRGTPHLRVSKEGIITVTPSEIGLFVFAVKVEEYRDGLKIGEVRRDFQMLVIDCPPPGIKPMVQVKPPDSEIFTSTPDTIRFQVEESKCFELQARDRNTMETLTLMAIPVNFEGEIDSIFSLQEAFLEESNELFKVDVCLPDCPFLEGGAAVVDLVARDDACPQPLMDTVRVIMVVEPPPNEDPFFTNEEETIDVDVVSGELVDIPIEGVDPDGDFLILDIIPIGFDPDAFGIDFPVVKNEAGEIAAQLQWDTDCNTVDFTRDNFSYLLVLQDIRSCPMFAQPDTLRIDIDVELTPNTPPEVGINDDNTLVSEITVQAGKPIDLEVIGVDPDNDSLNLKLISVDGGITLDDFQFQPDSATGNVSSRFFWQTACSQLNDSLETAEFVFVFSVSDEHCVDPVTVTDTLTVKLDNIPIQRVFEKPPNVFTPNGDGINEAFFIPDLPEGNCNNRFREIRIFNRWGREVFTESNRDFLWHGTDLPPSVYYYTVIYDSFELNGIVSIVR